MLTHPKPGKASWQTPKLLTLDIGRTLSGNNPSQLETFPTNCVNGRGLVPGCS